MKNYKTKKKKYFKNNEKINQLNFRTMEMIILIKNN